jgi:hypothetical protein
MHSSILSAVSPASTAATVNFSDSHLSFFSPRHWFSIGTSAAAQELQSEKPIFLLYESYKSQCKLLFNEFSSLP